MAGLALLQASAATDNSGFFRIERTELGIWHFSPNGQWLVGQDEYKNVFIYDRANEKWYEYTATDDVKYGAYDITDDGLIGGAYGGVAATWTPEDGWVELPSGCGDDRKATWVYSISNNGKFITGARENHKMSVKMGTEPGRSAVVWTRNDDGTYSAYDNLPDENADYAGLCPQAFDGLVTTSGNGGSIIGRYIDNSGLTYLPVRWTKEENKWVRTTYGENLVFNLDKPRPQMPRVSPIGTEPDPAGYMSEDERAVYDEDMKAYEDSVAAYVWPYDMPYPSYNPKDHAQEYFDIDTPEGVGRWNEYATAWQEYASRVTAWNDSLDAADAAKSEYLKGTFAFNLSGTTYINQSENGKWALAGTTTLDMETFYTAECPVLVNLETGEVSGQVLTDGGYYVTDAVLDDGTAFVSAELASMGLVVAPGSGTGVPFDEWIKERSEQAYEALTTGMSDDGITKVKVYWADGKGERFSGYVWHSGIQSYVCWYLDLTKFDDYAGTGLVETAAPELRLEGRTLRVEGMQSESVQVYNIAGQLVYSSMQPGNTYLLDSLAEGIYIVRVAGSTEDPLVRKIRI